MFDFTPQPRPAAPGTIGTGGQGTRGLLTSTLREGRRRARLTGRQLSQAETKGITGGYFGQASERLGQRKGLALAERGQEVTMRGQDIGEMLGRENIGLGYAGLTSAEKMHTAGLTSTEKIEEGRLGLGYAGITSQEKMAQSKIASAESMFKQGLISQKELQGVQIAATKEIEEGKRYQEAMQSTASLLSSLLSSSNYVPSEGMDIDLWSKYR